MGTTEHLCNFVAKTTFDDIPSAVVHEAKRLILDTLGCALGGYSTDRGQIGIKVAKELGGNPKSSIVGCGIKTSPPNAAYVNSSMGNILDYDETYLNLGHYACPVVFSALSVGEELKCSGRDFITAVVIGYDVTARIANSTGYLSSRVERGKLVRRPVSGLSYQTVGAAASVGKTLGLGAEQLAHAFGLAAHFGPSPTLAKWTSYPKSLPMIKYGDSGWLALGGVMASLLTQGGYTAYPSILDGDDGFWRMYGGAECDFDIMCRKLGQEWWILHASYKPWPSCRYTHHALTALTKILDKEAIRREKISKIAVKGGMTWLPMFSDQDPKTIQNAQFSLPYAVSMVVFDIKPGPLWCHPEVMNNPEFKAFRKKVILESDPEFIDAFIEQITGTPPKFIKRVPVTVTVITEDGEFSESVEYATGDPDSWAPREFAITDEGLAKKFKINATNVLGCSSSGKDRIDEIVRVVNRLEEVSNLADLAELLSAL